MKSITYHSRVLYALLALLGVMAGACEDYLGGDTNVDPTRPDAITLEAYLPTIVDATAEAHYYAGYQIGQVSQQLASYFATGADIQEEFRIGTGWTFLYLRSMANAQLLREQAEQASPHYAGVAKVLQALNLGIATDAWENVPFTGAFQGTENLTPAYDEQSAIYETIIPDLLDGAIADLRAESSQSSPGSDDLIYGGDLSQWIKTAQVLKARYAIHLINKGATEAASEALAALAEGYQSNGDDFELVFDERNLNPWHARVALAINTGNFTVAPGAQLVDLMNGEQYGVIDPRLPLMFDLADSQTDYEGMVNGTEGGNTVDLTDNTWYFNAEAPLLMVTYAEAKFIEAEAHFIVNGGDAATVGSTEDAYQAYLDGIAAHLQKLGVDEAAAQAYLTDPRVAVGAENLSLDLIMKEKYIALFLNPEVWVDLRRYDYRDEVFAGFSLPENHNPLLNGEYIERASYPFDELNRNEAAVEANQQPLSDEMWRDQ